MHALSKLVYFSTLLVCVSKAVAQSVAPPPEITTAAQGVESCLIKATQKAQSTKPTPSIESVMGACSNQWTAVQKVFPADAYAASLKQARKTIAQQLATAKASQ